MLWRVGDGMDNSTNVEIGGGHTLPAVVFETQGPPKRCSWNEGLCGHTWPVRATVTSCVCGAAILAIQQENCPYCNEAKVKTVLRTDHVPVGAPTMPMCKGQSSPNIEVVGMEVQWTTEPPQ